MSMQRTALELPDSTEQKSRLVERDDPLLHVERVEHPSIAGYSQQQCCPFTGIGPEAKSKPVTLRIKYGIYPIKSGIYPNPAAESNLG